MNRKHIGNVILDLSFYKGEDKYTDGSIEEEILDSVKAFDNDNFEDLIKENKNWPFLYHLSNIRTNIIEWLPIDKEKTVLEIGSGCGAITGKLSEMAKSVTCIELSKKRSLINAYRNKNMSNIEILIGNFSDIEKEINKKYDFIVLIGVLEYAESYIPSQNPYEDFLKKIKRHLTDNGCVIIAIENKFGLKYWAGCKEDHVDRYFEGIEGYSQSSGVKTFSKTELKKLFKESGFHKYDFYYPYPDYKLPYVIYSDNYLPKKGELTKNIRNFNSDRLVIFDENKVFDSIIESNLFSIFSNSYLIILQKDGEHNE